MLCNLYILDYISIKFQLRGEAQFQPQHKLFIYSQVNSALSSFSRTLFVIVQNHPGVFFKVFTNN